jgi:phosphopantetheine--protein transferase-like protein
VTPRAGHFVGVDVVDLDDPRCVGKEREQRFLKRLLTDAERELMKAAGDPILMLWRLWAAKEAAFKVASKVRGAPPVFVHAAFRVHPDDSRALAEFGTVAWEDVKMRVHWHDLPGRVVAVGWNDGATADDPVQWGWGAAAELDPAPEETLEALVERLTERERRPVHSRGSAVVRLTARTALAQLLEVEEARVQIVCGEGPKGRMPPEVLLDGEPAPADVSLSHHGRWLAWALRVPPPPAPEPEPEPEAEGRP